MRFGFEYNSILRKNENRKKKKFIYLRSIRKTVHCLQMTAVFRLWWNHLVKRRWCRWLKLKIIFSQFFLSFFLFLMALSALSFFPSISAFFLCVTTNLLLLLMLLSVKCSDFFFLFAIL